MKLTFKNKGFAQIPVLLALLVMAIAIPLATKLVQQNAENRGRAMYYSASVGATEGAFKLTFAVQSEKASATQFRASQMTGAKELTQTIANAYVTIRARNAASATAKVEQSVANCYCNTSGLWTGKNCSAEAQGTHCSAPKVTPTTNPLGCYCMNGQWQGQCAFEISGASCGTNPNNELTVLAGKTCGGSGYSCVDDISAWCDSGTKLYDPSSSSYCQYGCGDGMCKAKPTDIPTKAPTKKPTLPFNSKYCSTGGDVCDGNYAKQCDVTPLDSYGFEVLDYEYCQYGCAGGKCKPAPTKGQPTPTKVLKTIVTTYPYYPSATPIESGPGVDNPIATVNPTATPTVTPTITPTATPTINMNAVNLVANVTFAGVNGSAQCANNWLVKTITLGEGKTEVDTNIQAVRTGAVVSNLEVFKVTVNIDSLTSRTGLALFLKGPSHLQMKYAVDGQEKDYDKAGGQLCIGDSCPSVYDFTKLPMLAGDVNQDGMVNGIDFSIVKTDSITRKTVEAGGYMRSDLNGNCQMESQDLTLLMLSLSYKQSQLY